MNEQEPVYDGESYIQFAAPGVPYSAIRVPLTREGIAQGIAAAKVLTEQYAAAFGHQNTTPTNQGGSAPAQRVSGQSRGQSRADKYPLLEGWQCDNCGGPCGRYPKTGNMRSDKAVCLGSCKDGTFIHTVGWLDGEQPGMKQSFGGGAYEPQPTPPIEAYEDALPF